MTARRRLENRRPCESFSIQLAGQRYVVSVGRFPDGAPAELFISNGKAGSDSDANARDIAIAASPALQFGCPIDVLQRALVRDSRGCASTPLGAALDLIAGPDTP
jgi:hypothetical protein